MADNVLYVNMLGNFSLKLDDQTISCDNNRSKQIWNLLAFLICNSGKVMPTADLASLLWDSDKGDNSIGAIKTAMHRVRATLDKLRPNAGKQMLLYKDGGYMWNPDICMILDTNRFVKLLSKSDAINIEDELEMYLEAISLYKGKFLSGLSNESWIIPPQTYYNDMYLVAIEKIMPVLEKKGRYSEAVEICKNALQINQYTESLYQHLMRFLLILNKRAEVVEIYEEMSKLLLGAFGVIPNQESRSLYRAAIQTEVNRVMNPERIMEQLNETGDITGALCCDFDFFKMLYQANARTIVRNGDAIHIALLTLKKRTNKDVSPKSISIAMDNLENHMCKSLRKGDVISRCSASQFVIMLPQANYENSCMVCKRFIDSFERKYPHSPIYVDYYVTSLLPSTLG